MKNSRLTASDITQWIDNDEGLYIWWKRSKQKKSVFIKENRTELESCIHAVLNKSPQR